MKVAKSPYHLALELLNNDAINSFFNQAINGLDSTNLRDFTPHFEWLKQDNNYMLTVDLPSIDKNEVSIAIENRQLEIKGQRKTVSTNEGTEILSSSIKYGKFNLKFNLPLEADTENLKAKFENGTLQVSIPVAAKAQKQLIAIE